MATPTEEETQLHRTKLLLVSRNDADRWIGENSDYLCEVAYAVSRSGGSFDTVAVNVLIKPEDEARAGALIPDLGRSVRNFERSDNLFDCYERTAVRAKRTFNVYFYIEKER